MLRQYTRQCPDSRRTDDAGSSTEHRRSGSVASVYTAWDTAEPGKGYDAKAAEWKGKPDAAASTPDKK